MLVPIGQASTNQISFTRHFNWSVCTNTQSESQKYVC